MEKQAIAKELEYIIARHDKAFLLWLLAKARQYEKYAPQDRQ